MDQERQISPISKELSQRMKEAPWLNTRPEKVVIDPTNNFISRGAKTKVYRAKALFPQEASIPPTEAVVKTPHSLGIERTQKQLSETVQTEAKVTHRILESWQNLFPDRDLPIPLSQFYEGIEIQTVQPDKAREEEKIPPKADTILISEYVDSEYVNFFKACTENSQDAFTAQEIFDYTLYESLRLAEAMHKAGIYVADRKHNDIRVKYESSQSSTDVSVRVLDWNVADIKEKLEQNDRSFDTNALRQIRIHLGLFRDFFGVKFEGKKEIYGTDIEKIAGSNDTFITVFKKRIEQIDRLCQAIDTYKPRVVEQKAERNREGVRISETVEKPLSYTDSYLPDTAANAIGILKAAFLKGSYHLDKLLERTTISKEHIIPHNQELSIRQLKRETILEHLIQKQKNESLLKKLQISLNEGYHTESMKALYLLFQAMETSYDPNWSFIKQDAIKIIKEIGKRMKAGESLLDILPSSYEYEDFSSEAFINDLFLVGFTDLATEANEQRLFQALQIIERM